MAGVSGRRPSLLVLLLCSTVLVGCGAAAGTSPTPSPPKPTTAVLKGRSFTLPTELPAGQHTFTFSTPDPAGHTALLVSLHPGVSLDQLLADMWGSHSAKSPAQSAPFAQRAESEADSLGGAMVSPDGPASFTTVLTSGTYQFIDFDGAGLAERHPVAQEFRVTGADPAQRPLPAADAVVVSNAENGRKTYALSGVLRAHGTLRYTNRAGSVEEAALFRVKPGTTAQDITTYFQNAFGGTGKPASIPFLAGPHGIPGTATGHTVTLELSVPPGQYALVSFAVDPRDGRRAASEGMFQLVTLR